MSRHYNTRAERARWAEREARARQAEARRQDAENEREVRREEREAIRDAKTQAREERETAREVEQAGLERNLDAAAAVGRETAARLAAIEHLLTSALNRDPAIDLTADIRPFVPRSFDEGRWPLVPPDQASFEPKPPGFFARMLPGAAGRFEKVREAATARFHAYEEEFHAKMEEREASFQRFQRGEEQRLEAWKRSNRNIRDMQRGLESGEHEPVVEYYKRVFTGAITEEADAIAAEIGYSPDSRHLVVDLEMPDMSVIPEVVGAKYVKAANRTDKIELAPAKRKALYSNLICQVALKGIDTAFRAAPAEGVVETLTLNGMLDSIDPSVGRNVRVCLVSVRVTADTFSSLNLGAVQPEQCLKGLKALVSRSPSELTPVRPIVNINMVDPRFIETTDVMSNLSTRPNLMELSPNEFENLITNLFSSMGLDTKQTRASRDGGVDCVAFDPRPVLGGKVIIQAKRYRHTVGISAVRDLWGATDHEGASKGILVTTSGYGKSAYEWSKGKPIELLDGRNLLHLLAEHAGIDARIEVPEGWQDPPMQPDE